MAQRADIREREHSKFVESPTRPGESAVEISGSVATSPFAPPPEADAFTRQVIGNMEIIEYRTGSITGPIIKTIKVYYQTAPSPDLIAGEIV